MLMTATVPDYICMSAEEYGTKANREAMVIIQFEDAWGIENFESIVKTDGLDCVDIGKNDFALSMGHPGRVDAPEVQEAIEKVATMTLDAGLTLI
jgi:2-dehydro-3-deoxyglucarate aldolase